MDSDTRLDLVRTGLDFAGYFRVHFSSRRYFCYRSNNPRRKNKVWVRIVDGKVFLGTAAPEMERSKSLEKALIRFAKEAE